MWGALFPGQGSQSVGMGKFLYDNFLTAKHTFEEASDTLGLNFKKLCFEGSEADLHLTENTQPALLLVSTATFRVVAESTGIKISAASGHSVGEYAAVVSAGAIAFADGLRAVRARGQAMQQAVPIGQGGMLAVLGLSDQQVIRLCAWAQEESGLQPLEPANFNAPGQVVISGSLKLIDWLKANSARTQASGDTAGIFAPENPRMKLIPLAVSAPFHCSLMKPAEECMKLVLEATQMTDAKWPIIQNFTAEPVTFASKLRENLIRQISGPVRWTQCSERLKKLGITRTIEFGSGKVLSGLAKKIDSEGRAPFNINTLDDLNILELAIKETAV